MPTGGPEVFPQGELWSVLMSCLCKQNPGTWSERLRVVSFLLWVTGVEMQSICLMVDSHGYHQANILDSRIWARKSQRDRMLHGHMSSQHSHGPVFPIWVDRELAKVLNILSYLRTSRPCSEGSFSAWMVLGCAKCWVLDRASAGKTLQTLNVPTYHTTWNEERYLPNLQEQWRWA